MKVIVTKLQVKCLQYLSKENVHKTVNLSYASLSEEFRYYCTSDMFMKRAPVLHYMYIRIHIFRRCGYCIVWDILLRSSDCNNVPDISMCLFMLYTLTVVLWVTVLNSKATLLKIEAQVLFYSTMKYGL